MQTVGRFAAAAVMAAALLVTGCSHRSASEITGIFAPYLRTRDLAVENAALAKQFFDTASIGQLNICYNDLRTKAGQYADFIAGMIRTASYDESQNQRDEHDLEVSIASYNDCTLKVQRPRSQRVRRRRFHRSAPNGCPRLVNRRAGHVI